MIGRVVATKSLKTAKVIVENMAKHPLYKKTFVQSKKYLVDTPIEVKEGDVVEFISCRPISKNKHWLVTKVLGRTFAEIAEAQLKEAAESLISEVMPAESSLVQASEGKKEEVVMDNSTVKPKSKKKGRTELSK